MEKNQRRLFHLSLQQQSNNESIKKIQAVPDKFKKPLCGYNVFVKEQFPLLRKAHKTNLEITKLIGQKWKRMTVEERKPYVESQLEPLVKKSLTAYNFYCKEKYPIFNELHTGLTSQEINRLVADSWKNATKSEKDKYYEMQQKLKNDVDLWQQHVIHTRYYTQCL